MIAKSLVSAWSIHDTAIMDSSKYYIIRIFSSSSGYPEMKEWLDVQSRAESPKCAPRPGWDGYYWVHEQLMTMFTLKFGPGYGYDD